MNHSLNPELGFSNIQSSRVVEVILQALSESIKQYEEQISKSESLISLLVQEFSPNLPKSVWVSTFDKGVYKKLVAYQEHSRALVSLARAPFTEYLVEYPKFCSAEGEANSKICHLVHEHVSRQEAEICFLSSGVILEEVARRCPNPSRFPKLLPKAIEDRAPPENLVRLRFEWGSDPNVLSVACSELAKQRKHLSVSDFESYLSEFPIVPIQVSESECICLLGDQRLISNLIKTLDEEIKKFAKAEDLKGKFYTLVGLETQCFEYIPIVI